MMVNYSNMEVILNNKKSIFLAGPTPRDKETKSWRPDAIKYLEAKHFDGIVYYPEYENIKKIDYEDQVEWERKALINATVIVFWIPRDLEKMPALTTNVEFGYWIAREPKKIIYGRPDKAKKNKYLDWLFSKESKEQIYNNLEETLDRAVEIINKEHIV